MPNRPQETAAEDRGKANPAEGSDRRAHKSTPTKAKGPTQTAANPPRELSKRLPAHKMFGFADILKTNADLVEATKLNELIQAMHVSGDYKSERGAAEVVKALDLFEAIAPADALESMLAVQMLGTHSAAVVCLARGSNTALSLEVRYAALAHARRLMSLYTQQMTALDKRRGKGQQKVTVEHVHVGAGGQAIVGNVEHRGKVDPVTGGNDQPLSPAPAAQLGSTSSGGIGLEQLANSRPRVRARARAR